MENPVRIMTEEVTQPNAETSIPEADKPEGSYVKFAMRNMVKKRGTSLKHFFLTTFALLSFFIGMAYLTR